MSTTEMIEINIDSEDTLSSSCTNSEIEVSSDLKDITGLVSEDIKDVAEKLCESDAGTTPDSEESEKEKEDQIDNGQDSTAKESLSQAMEDNENKAVKITRLHYTREELMTVMHHPLARNWPNCIDPSFQKMQGNSMKVDLDRLVKFSQETKRSSQLTEGTETVPTPLMVPDKNEAEPKKLKDPRERIKQEEQDGIVLSPQRRSFGTGCRVQHHLPSFLQGKRSADASADGQPQREMNREMASRRIGSGRIVRREDLEGMPDNREYRKDFAEVELRHRDWRMKNEGRYEKYRDDSQHFPSAQNTNYGRNDKRRNFYEQERMQHPDKRDKRRVMDSRRMGQCYVEEAPEWFTGGPSSQNEFIELVGFDEEDKDSRGKHQHKEYNNYVSKKKVSRSNTPTIKEVDETEEIEQKVEEMTKPALVEPENDQDVMHFNIDNIILGDFLDVGSGEVYHSSGKSRLKQFFQDRSSPPKEVQEANNPLGGLFGLKEPVIQVTPTHPNDPNSRQFTPITSNAQQSSVADLFNQNGSLGRLSAQLNNPPSVNDLLMGGKGQALQDIEANLCNQLSEPSKNTDLNRNADQKGAFNQFLLNGGVEEASKAMHSHQPTVPNNTPMENDLLAMLLKNNLEDGINQIIGQKLQQSQLLLPFHNGMPPPVRQTSPTFLGPQQNSDIQRQLSNQLSLRQSQNNQETLMKLLQQQQQQKKQSQLLHPGFQQHQDPIKQLIGGVGSLNVNGQSQGMMNPDAQMLFQRLNSGQVTENQLLTQLSSQNINSQQREAISTVLKLVHCHPGNVLGQRSALTPSPTPVGGINLATTPISLSPRVASPNPDFANLLSAPHVIPQRVSPLMFNAAMSGNARRQPSHQELVAHTQSILQKALIKQELEKAKEKHRKREHERIKSPNMSVNVLSTIANSMGDSRNVGKSASPLVFTPTSVMRKMTEKDKNSLQEMNRHSNHGAANFYQNQAHVMQGNVDPKKEMCNKNFVGPKTNVAMCGLNAASSSHMMPQNRQMVPQHAPIPRHNQGPNPHGLRGQGQVFGNMCQPGIQNRMQGPPPNSIHHLLPSKNNNGFFGMKSDNVAMAQMSANQIPSINLANLFGREIVAQAQNGKLPDLPGGQALSLEEVEKLQQSQANKVLSCYKYVR